MAYEDIRLKPRNKLAEQLTEGYVEDFISEMEGDMEIIDDIQKSGEDDHNIALQLSDSTTENTSLTDAEGPSSNKQASSPSQQTTALMSQNKRQTEPNCDNMTTSSPAEMDIGTLARNVQNMADVNGHALSSQKQNILAAVKSRVKQRQVTASTLEFAPQWLLDEALQAEIDDNCHGAFSEIPAFTIEENANVIRSHVVHKVKEENNGTLKLKARLVLHGNRNKDRFTVRRDSA